MQGINFEELFERLSSPHMVLNDRLEYVALNAAYEEAVSRNRGELIGRNLFEMFPNDGEGGRKLRASLQKVLDTGESDTIAYIAYDIPRPQSEGGGMLTRYWTAVHTALTDGQGRVTHVMQNTVDVTEMAQLREAASLPFSVRSGAVKLVERAREAEDAHRSLLSESAEFRRMFQQAPGFIAVLSGPDHVFTFANDAYRKLVGDRDVLNKTVAEALPEVVGQGFSQLLDKVYTTGNRHLGEGTRVMLRREAGEAPHEVFLDFSYDAIKDLDGKVTGIFVQGMDRTEAVRTLRYQRLLMDELNHRVKNTLATVQSIASQTLRAAPDLESAKRSFEARIVALSKAHNILSARRWSDASLRQIVSNELEAHGVSRIGYDGPTVMLNPKASIAVAMVIHELATNAAKFGALSVPEGRLGLSWRVDSDETLRLEWEESHGPAAKAPGRRGFGSRMIERVLRMELGGDYSCAYEEAGFTCSFAIPASVYGRMEDAA